MEHTQKSHRLSLAQALLSRSTLVSLAASNPALALALQTIRLRVLLRQYMAAASQRPSKEGLQTDAVQYGTSGWEAAVHAASQPPQPHAEGPQSMLMHRLGMLELLMGNSVMSAGAGGPLHTAEQPANYAADATSQCCESRQHKESKRAAYSSDDDVAQPGAKRMRKYAYIEVHISNSPNSHKPACHLQAHERALGQVNTHEGSGTDCSASTYGQPIQELAWLAHRRSSSSADLHESSLGIDSELEDDASTMSLASRQQTPERQWCQVRHCA